MQLIPVEPVQPQPIKAASSIECTICTLVINLAESALGSNASETAIEDFLDNTVCAILPFGLGQDCDSFVTQYLPALVQFIQLGESGAIACAQIGVCSNTSVTPLLQLRPVQPVQPQPVQSQAGGALECLICTTVINLAESILGSNASESAIEDFLDNTVCGLLPNTLGQDCDLLVATYLPALVQYIQQGESGAIACGQIGLCNSTSVTPLLQLKPIKPAVQVAEPKNKGPIECTVCTLLVSLAESYLGSNATEEQIENFLNNTACSILPSTFADICDAIVQQYTPALVQAILAQESPSTACTQIGLCSSVVPDVLPNLQ
jgi:saposin